MSHPRSLRSEIRFGAFLVYSPRCGSEVSRLSRTWRDAIKFDRPPGIDRAVEQLARRHPATPFGDLLGPDVVLVPAPRSTPLVRGALRPARRIADAMAANGLGSGVVPCVVRVEPVGKSAFAIPGQRPTARQHWDSMRCVGCREPPSRIAVVDDVVTKGATLLATVSILSAEFPRASVVGFALLRTMGLQPEVERVLDPCVGLIRLVGDEAERRP